MSGRKLLLTLLVHRQTRENYYRDHDLYVAKQKAWLEEIRQEPFDAMPEERQTYYLDTWFWAPWRFNNIVGFAEIELETQTDIVGHLYMPERMTRVTKKPLLLNYACAAAHFEKDDLQSLRTAIFKVIKQLKSMLKDRKWILEVNQELINHTDFLAMIKAMEEKNDKPA
jgi:hypothetical protein